MRNSIGIVGLSICVRRPIAGNLYREPHKLPCKEDQRLTWGGCEA